MYTMFGFSAHNEERLNNVSRAYNFLFIIYVVKKTDYLDKFKISLLLNKDLEESLVLANNLEDVLVIPLTSKTCDTSP